jgi:hypothetical protein
MYVYNLQSVPPRFEYEYLQVSLLYVGLTAGLGIVTLGLSGFRITPKRSSSLGRAWIFAILALSA